MNQGPVLGSFEGQRNDRYIGETGQQCSSKGRKHRTDLVMDVNCSKRRKSGEKVSSDLLTTNGEGDIDASSVLFVWKARR